MSAVQHYLDCGCALMDDGSRSWCPSCLSPPTNEYATKKPKSMSEYRRLKAHGFIDNPRLVELNRELLCALKECVWLLERFGNYSTAAEGSTCAKAHAAIQKAEANNA